MMLYPELEFNTYVVAQAHHYGHKLSFEKFSNCGWGKELAFVNGGIGVHLLKLDMSKLSESRQTIDAYKEIDQLPDNSPMQPQLSPEESEEKRRLRKRIEEVTSM